jgi:Ca2+-binding EF-hand superfamily protein
MNFWEIVSIIQKFLEREDFETEEVIKAVRKIDKDQNGRISYRELVLELGESVTQEDRSLKWTTRVVALLGACLVGLVLFLQHS